MATTYKDWSGKTYSPSQVEKVGSSYYVKGTSINVSPASSSGGTSTSTTKSTTTSTTSKTSGATTKSTPSIFTPYSSALIGAVASALPAALSAASALTKPTGGGGGGGGSSSKIPDFPGPIYSDTPGSPYFKDIDIGGGGGGGGGGSSGGSLSPLAVAGYYWGQGYYPGRSSSDSAIVKAMQDRIKQLEMQNQQLMMQQFMPPQINFPQMTQITPPVTPPPKVEEAPKVEIPATQQEQVGAKSELPQTAAGFVAPGTALPAVPTVESLFDVYKQVFGRGGEQERAYLASPQFQGILQSGNVPMWMSADPLWRLYLIRIGVLNPNRDTARERAIQDRLSGAAG